MLDERIALYSVVSRIAEALPKGVPAYIIGGTVRDMLLGKEIHDLDIAVGGDGILLGRSIAAKLGATFFILDQEHSSSRLFLTQPDGSRIAIDVAALRGKDLEADQRSRDFTINSMALDVRKPEALLDPLFGARDLKGKILRACSDTAFLDDPVRIVRAVRQSVDFGLRIEPGTRNLMAKEVSGLEGISPERLRDELFRIFDGQKPAACLRVLDHTGALSYILPETSQLKGVEQPPPHLWDVWKHSLAVLDSLSNVLNALGPHWDPDKASSLHLGLMVLRLGKYRQQIEKHLKSPFNLDRSHHALLYLAGIYHDIGKPDTKQVDKDGKVRFLGHEELGRKMISERARNLRLSNAEISCLETIVQHHMRPLWLAKQGIPPSRRAVYRFFRDAGKSGIDICLLSLADTLAIYGTTLTVEIWSNLLEIIQTLFEAWWEKPAEQVRPEPLLNGHDLMAALGIKPGPEVGELLEAIRESQATGEINSRVEALDLAKERVRGRSH